jgi:mannose-6-phosphate isomerase-like protein (cupin superfamily)
MSTKNNKGKCCCEDVLKDYGPCPVVLNIDALAKENPNYRLALWTGTELQVTLMSIDVGDDIGLEMHPDTDQFIRIECGCALVEMGASENCLCLCKHADKNSAIIVPAGTWHNVTNIGDTPLKVYSIYAPPHHPHGTIEPTKPVEG